MLSNKLFDTVEIETKLDNLSNAEALTIGKSLSFTLMDRLVAAGGIDLWVHQYPALADFQKRHRFFLPLALTIGQRKLDEAPWGLALKVGLGALLSITDVVTDIYAIFMLRKQSKKKFANAIATSKSDYSRI